MRITRMCHATALIRAAVDTVHLDVLAVQSKIQLIPILQMLAETELGL
jgi:hypothetical protein